MENEKIADTQRIHLTVLAPNARLSTADYPASSHSGAAHLDALEASYVQMYHIWFELYCDTEWWVSPRKRQAMLRARLAYQDASLLYFYSRKA